MKSLSLEGGNFDVSPKNNISLMSRELCDDFQVKELLQIHDYNLILEQISNETVNSEDDKERCQNSLLLTWPFTKCYRTI